MEDPKTLEPTSIVTYQPIRGAIRVTVSTSTDNLIAGQPFSIFVQVHNPFGVPLLVHRVSTYLPTEFVDIDAVARDEKISDIQEEIEALHDVAKYLGVDIPTFIPHKKPWYQRLINKTSRISFGGAIIEFKDQARIGPSIARSMTHIATSEVSAGISLPYIGKITQTIRKEIAEKEDDEVIKEQWKKRVEAQLKQYEDAMASLSFSEEPGKPLQPGNSTIHTFSVKSRKSIRFKPSSYRLVIEVEYAIENISNTDTIEHELRVRASIPSMIIGSMLGGACGWAASDKASLEFTPSIMTLFVSLVLAAMTVVLFARKKDAQPLLAIEDFWGGVAVGFLVAYSGPQLLENLP